MISCKKAFDKIYLETYGRLLSGINVRVINLRIAAIGNRPKLDLSSMASISSKSVEECQIETRLIWCDGAQVSAKVYERLDLPIGGKIVARESIKGFKKDVLTKIHGGGATDRKRKLLEKQKRGKARSKQFGKVEIPQEAFIGVLKISKES